MTEGANILIVEDELIIAEHIRLMLEMEGYKNVWVAKSYETALSKIQVNKPEVILADISLGNGKSGIDLAKYIKEHLQIPFIFITSLHSKDILRQASETQPHAYLVKPFKKEDLVVAIELATMHPRQPVAESNELNHLTVKDGHSTLRIPLSEIVLLKAEDNYTTINTSHHRPRIVRQYLGDLQSQLPQDQFIRVHRSYIVNRKFISEIHRNYIVILNFQLPVSRSYSHILQELKLR